MYLINFFINLLEDMMLMASAVDTLVVQQTGISTRPSPFFNINFALEAFSKRCSHIYIDSLIAESDVEQLIEVGWLSQIFDV